MYNTPADDEVEYLKRLPKGMAYKLWYPKAHHFKAAAMALGMYSSFIASAVMSLLTFVTDKATAQELLRDAFGFFALGVLVVGGLKGLDLLMRSLGLFPTHPTK